MAKYIDVDALWRDVTSNIEDCGDVLEIIERQPVVTINDTVAEIKVTNCNHNADASKKVSSSWGHENGLVKDCIGRTEAMTELMAIARRYTLASEAHGEGRVLYSSDYIDSGEAMDVLRRLPSVQPEIIHCRECKHWREGDAYSYCDKLFSMGVLDVYDYMTSEDDFCSNAERRTDAETEV